MNSGILIAFFSSMLSVSNISIYSQLNTNDKLCPLKVCSIIPGVGAQNAEFNSHDFTNKLNSLQMLAKTEYQSSPNPI